MKREQHKAQQGFVTFALNGEVDYLRLAYLQALSIKNTQNNNLYAVIVDKATENSITQKQKSVFDFIITLPENINTTNSKFAAEPFVFELTPFKETIKVEADLLFTRSVDHWWTALRLRDIVLSTGCRNFKDELVTSRAYRKFFDDNRLPDVYNGLMYFRYSRPASQFFMLARQIQDNWQEISNSALINCREKYPSTDVLYAITAATLGAEQCTIPTLSFFNFVHMKTKLQGWPGHNEWNDIVSHELDGDMIRINNLNQLNPVHYFNKSYVTDEMIEHYETRRV